MSRCQLTDSIVGDRREGRSRDKAQGEYEKSSEHGWKLIQVILLRYYVNNGENDVFDVALMPCFPKKHRQASLKEEWERSAAS